MNDYFIKEGITFVHSGVKEFYGQITTIFTGKDLCLCCIFSKKSPEYKLILILGPTAAILASMQVMEAIKIITRIGNPHIGRITFLDFEEMDFEIAKIERKPDCQVCCARAPIFLPIEKLFKFI